MLAFVRQAEVGAARTMIERTEERFGLKPERLAGDTAYGAAPMLNWLVEEKHGIRQTCRSYYMLLPLQARYALCEPREIAYGTDGGLVSSSQAFASAMPAA